MKKTYKSLTPTSIGLAGSQRSIGVFMRVPSVVTGVAAAMVVFAIAIFSDLKTESRQNFLVRHQNTPADIFALEGDTIEANFTFRNESDRETQITSILTSCTCLTVVSPDALPLIVPPHSEVKLTTHLAAEPVFVPMKLEVKVKTETSDMSNWYTSDINFRCRSKYRVSPAVVVFGEVRRSNGPISQIVYLFESEDLKDESTISQADGVNPMITVKVSENVEKKNPPSNYRNLGSLKVTFIPKDQKGVFQGEVQIFLGNGEEIHIPVSAITISAS